MVVFACSGPGAADLIARAELLGWLLFGLSALALATGVGVRAALGTPPRSWGSAVGITLLVLHPGLWWSARIGDCGGTREVAALAWAGVIATWGVIAVGAALVRRARARR